MKRQPFLLIMLALLGSLIYLFYSAEEQPEQATTLTPKQYIELVEKKKAARQTGQQNTATESTEKR